MPLVALVAAIACHRTAPPGEANAPRHRTLLPHGIAMIRVDGPGAPSLHPGDSVVLILNDREAWRGAYDAGAKSSGLRAALDRLVPGTDSVLSAELWTGRDVASRYRVGGRRPAVLIVRTAPPPE